MKSVAVICEYNPFHRGHLLLISEIKKLFPDHAVISIMSGNTVQRGEFAVLDKYERAENAVKAGSDLVIELPFPFSVSAGEQFARAGVCLANALFCDILAFGCSSEHISDISEYAVNLSSPSFDDAVKKEISTNKNISFIKARENAYRLLFGKSLPENGNDILSIEYLRAINENGYAITPEPIVRSENFSATESRSALFSRSENEIKRLIPEFCKINTLNDGYGSFYKLISSAILFSPEKDDPSGVSNAVRSAVLSSSSYEEFKDNLPTKTYTLARLKRQIFSMLFDVSDEDKNKNPEYTILLGASEKGLAYLSEKRKNLTPPILTKAADLQKLPPSALLCYRRAEKVERFFCLGYENRKFSPFSIPFML